MSFFCNADDGRVLKAVTVTKDNGRTEETEEIILEELTVFQVRELLTKFSKDTFCF